MRNPFHPINHAMAAATVVLLAFGLRGIYYRLKPALPLRLRLLLRRWLARGQRQFSRDLWPISPSAGRAPEGWPGWPGQMKFAFVLTHDVESERGLARVKQLAELELSMGFRSCFNFIPEGPYRVPDDLRHWLVERGFEVGVHDHRHDGTLYQSRRRFAASAERINHYLREWNAVGFRAGFMLRNLEWLQDLDIAYDGSTFDTDPFEPQPDGCNTIFPFRVNATGHPGYIELPYTLVQDSTLFLILQEPTNDIWKLKLEWIRACGGMALLNVHPDYLTFEERPTGVDEYPVRHYGEFLESVKRRFAGEYYHVIPRALACFFSSVRVGGAHPVPVHPRVRHANHNRKEMTRG